MSLSIKYTPEKTFERTRAKEVVSKLEDDGYSLPSCRWACRALLSITAFAAQTRNMDSMADFLDDGNCEAIILIMNKFSASVEDIASNTCLIVSILSSYMVEMREFLGEIGACELVVFAASMHVGNAEISEHALAAVCLLSKDNNANTFKLSDAGACDVITEVGHFGFNLQHEKCSTIAANVCIAFSHLAQAANANKLIDCDAIGLVTGLISVHIHNKDFTAAAIKAICSLSSLNVKHREEIGRVGGCKLVLQVMNLYPDDIVIIRDACESLLHLSLSPNNATKLGLDGAGKLLVTILNNKLMEVATGPEICSGAMLHLSMYGSEADKNRERLIESKAIDILRKAQLSSKASIRSRENIAELLQLLGAEEIPGSISGSDYKNNKKNYKLIHASEMKGDTIPLSVEVHKEVIEYDSFADFSNKSQKKDRGAHDSSNGKMNYQPYFDMVNDVDDEADDGYLHQDSKSEHSTSPYLKSPYHHRMKNDLSKNIIHEI